MRRRPPRREVRFATPLAAAFAVLGLAGCGGPPPQAAAQPVQVEVAPVEVRDVPVTEEWVASLHGFVDAQIRSQVTGYLLRQDYRDGAHVKQGQLLFEIDPRPFRAALAQAEGQLAVAKAQFGKSEQDVKRYGPLAKDEAISQQEYDDAVQANLAAQAQIQAAQAAVDQATLNLGFTEIRSPVDGLAGITQAQVGDLVGPGTGVLTTVSQVDPIRVYFPISEQSYLEFRAAHPGASGFPTDVPLQLVMSDGALYDRPGRVYATGREIDPGTGTLQIEALFDNPRFLLRPGQYGRVRAAVRTLRHAILVPQAAVTELQGGSQVVTVDATSKAHVVSIATGPRFGADVVVTQGLKPGDRVIVAGFQKVHDGTPVAPAR